jgi:hypothetical protein
MASLFSTSPNVKAEAASNADNTPNNTDSFNGFEVVAGDYMPNTEIDTDYFSDPYAAKPVFASGMGMQRVLFHQSDDWLTPTLDPTSATGLNHFQVCGRSPVSDAPSYGSYERMPSNLRTPPPPPPPLPPHPHNVGNGSVGVDGRLNVHPYSSGVAPGSTGSNGQNPYTYRGPNADYSCRRQNRLHQDFKALPKEERQRLVEREAATSDLLARTVHLRFLPLSMLQSELAEICSECGEYLRVRICGNSTNNQNWIYGFVEFATTSGAEAMMRRSGMELHNGPGRPPLRLKCNSAKQPIVDRVFHDADPATGNPCIFGLGNFAKRSLGDALESYYNLKEKEAHHMAEFSATATPSPKCLSPNINASASAVSTRPPMRLSPHARAFQPSATAMLGTELLPGVHSATTADSPNSCAGASAHWTSPALSTTALRPKADSASSSHSSSVGEPISGVKPTATTQHQRQDHCNHLGGVAVPSSAGTTPRVTFTPPQGYMAPKGRTSVTTAGAAPTRFASVQSDRVLFSDGPGAVAAHGPPGSRLGSFAADLLLPPSKYNAGGGSSTRPFGGASTPSDVAGNELSLALQNMMLTRAATDGEEVLCRGQELALRAIGQAHDFLNSQQGFYDAMGTLRSLIELLDCHAAVTGGAAATAAGDHTADLPQRATQLRLLANLMMALLYMMKRNLSDALPYIHAVVMSCNDIPVVRLWKAPQQQQTCMAAVAAAKSRSRSSSGGEKSTPSTAQKKLTQQWKGLAVGDAFQDTSDYAEGYDCFGAPSDFLEAVLESIRDDEEAEEEKEEGMGGRKRHNNSEPQSLTGPSSVNGDTSSTSSAETQALLRRDQAFHRYVLNVLVAIGLSMEEVQPVITRSTYTLAAGRARDVLNASCEDLDDCLQSTEANPHLSDRLYAPPLNASSRRDITFFPRLFFTSAEAMRQAVVYSADKDVFWQCLPPKQCVQCYLE